MDNNDKKILQGLICIIKNHKEFSDEDIAFLNGIYQIINTKENGLNIERWITVKGNYIPIIKGQNKVDAIKQFFKNKISEYKQKSTIAGVKKCKPMTFEQANQGRVNPHYADSAGYWNNCQTCVAVFEARLKGYDIEALPLNKKNAIMAELQQHPENAFIDKSTGKPPVRKYNTNVNSNDKMLEWLDLRIKKGQRYGFIYTHADGRHIIIAHKTKDGKLKFYDPQSGEDAKENVLSTIRYKTYDIRYNTYNCPPEIFRLDNTKLNKKYLNEISTKAKK